jgi:hypothetical protein
MSGNRYVNEILSFPTVASLNCCPLGTVVTPSSTIEVTLFARWEYVLINRHENESTMECNFVINYIEQPRNFERIHDYS